MAYITISSDFRPYVSPIVETHAAMQDHGEYAIVATDARTLRLTIAGFWSDAVMADFVRDLKAAVKGLGCPPVGRWCG